MSDDIITEEAIEQTDSFRKSLEDMKKQYERYLGDLRKVPESEESKKIEKKLNGLLEEIKNSLKIREKIQKEVLPEIMQKLGREENSKGEK